jgi:hypothetical protein
MALSGLMVLGWVFTGHAAKPARHGIPLPTDWSHQHLIFSRPGTAEEFARVSRDPRYQQQIHRRGEALMLPEIAAFMGAGPFAPAPLKRQGKRFKRDWAADMGAGASAGAGNYPAKFSFDTTTANCGDAATPDYVVYSTGLTGSATQASIVAYDNIYAGCSNLKLGTAASFAVLGSATVTNAGNTVVTGANIGVSPGTSLTGFPPGVLTPPAVEHLGDPVAAQAQADANTAFTFYKGLTGAGLIDSLDGLTLPPGLYKSSAASLALSAGATVTLNGRGTYIFQIGSTLELAGTVILSGGARADDVIWQVGSSATIDGNGVAVGNIIAQASITMGSGASLSGRAIALAGAITLIDNAITSSVDSVPSVYWSYNTGGRIATSPVLSLDGKQVAFVETSGPVGILTMLKWAAAPGGTVGAPQTLTPVATSAYPSCTAPCMTQISLKDGSGVSTDDTTSWAYYDYDSDVAWVGGASGWLHKVAGVFKGTPAEVDNGVFPVQVSITTAWLSSPIYDSVSNNVFVGDADGFLYSVNATSGIAAKSAKLDFGVGLVAPPLVDSTHQWVYVFASSDNSAACTGGVACSAVYQLSTSFLGDSAGIKVTVGNSVVLGSLTHPNPLYAGAFDSSYYNSVNATGNLYVCGNTGAVPTLYAIPIVAGIPGTASSAATLATPSSTAACSPLTDVPSPTSRAAQTERLFFSVQNNGLPLCASSGGCVFDLLDTPWQPTTAYSVGQRIFSRNRHVETVLIAGTSGTTTPPWTSDAGTKTIDDGVTWIDEGNLNQALTNNWQPSHVYTLTNDLFIDSNGNIEVSTTPGTSGSAQPIWNTAVGGTTPDGTVTWTNAGAAGIAALPAAGGASGMIIDNTVSSGPPGDSPANSLGPSQIYFTTLANQPCGTSGTGGCAVQASQAALQ